MTCLILSELFPRSAERQWNPRKHLATAQSSALCWNRLLTWQYPRVCLSQWFAQRTSKSRSGALIMHSHQQYDDRGGGKVAVEPLAIRSLRSTPGIWIDRHGHPKGYGSGAQATGSPAPTHGATEAGNRGFAS